MDQPLDIETRNLTESLADQAEVELLGCELLEGSGMEGELSEEEQRKEEA